MEFNPIKRIKLHLELRKNDKKFRDNSIVFEAMSETFYNVYKENTCDVDDGTIKALETIKNKEASIVDENDAIIKRNDEIYKQLYGGLK